jgi:hypothetical protein
VFNTRFGKIGSKGETLFVLIWFGRSRGVHLNHPKTGSARTPSVARFTHKVKTGLAQRRQCQQADRYCGGRAAHNRSVTGVKSGYLPGWGQVRLLLGLLLAKVGCMMKRKRGEVGRDGFGLRSLCLKIVFYFPVSIQILICFEFERILHEL